MKKQPPSFTATEQQVLAMLQDDLPDSATPFADIAAACGTTEEHVLELAARLKASGVIRRFGATLRHQKAGYGHNAMVAWLVPDTMDADAIGKLMASRPEVSHCYRRITYPQWPYNLYTMLHGQTPGQCRQVAAELSRISGVERYEILESIRELKKTSMRYFDQR